MSQPLAAGRGHPRCSATLQAGANGTFRQRQRQKCSGADDVPGVRRTSYYLELQQQDGIFGEQKPPYLEKAGVDDLRTFGPWRREAYEICAGSPELPAKRPERLAAYTNWLAKPAKPAQVIDVTAMTAGCFARRRQSPKRSWLRRRRRCPARQRVPAWIVPTSQNAQNTRKIGFGIVLGENMGEQIFISVFVIYVWNISNRLGRPEDLKDGCPPWYAVLPLFWVWRQGPINLDGLQVHDGPPVAPWFTMACMPWTRQVVSQEKGEKGDKTRDSTPKPKRKLKPLFEDEVKPEDQRLK